MMPGMVDLAGSINVLAFVLADAVDEKLPPISSVSSESTLPFPTVRLCLRPIDAADADGEVWAAIRTWAAHLGGEAMIGAPKVSLAGVRPRSYRTVSATAIVDGTRVVVWSHVSGGFADAYDYSERARADRDRYLEALTRGEVDEQPGFDAADAAAEVLRGVPVVEVRPDTASAGNVELDKAIDALRSAGWTSAPYPGRYAGPGFDGEFDETGIEEAEDQYPTDARYVHDDRTYAQDPAQVAELDEQARADAEDLPCPDECESCEAGAR